jgi:serine/threonine protein kinase
MIKIPLKFSDNVKINDDFKNFISGCLKVEENERFSWKDIFTHKLFNNSFKQFI